jgi:hypothetical protein
MIRKTDKKPGVVAHALGDGDREDHSSKPALTKELARPHFKNKQDWRSDSSGTMCIACLRPLVQTPVPPKKEKKKLGPSRDGKKDIKVYLLCTRSCYIHDL